MTSSVPGRSAHNGWPRLGGAILLLALVAACGTSSTTTPSGAAPSLPPATASAAGTASAGSASAGAASAIPGSPTDMLASALEPLRASSTFDTVVTVAGSTVLTAHGRSVGAASTSTVTTESQTVDYVRIPPNAWARQSSGAWVLVAANTAPGAPIDALAAPTSVALDTSGSGATLSAVYPAAALGLTGDPITVAITIQASDVKFAYTVTTSGKTTISTTTLQPGTNDPITAPAP